ncbi:MAG: RsmB/NOP family class I SAM-dependent RNA methyltransferase [Pseudomonadota bacterium]
MPKTPGLHARRAALTMIDAVLHRGETLEQAAPGALRDVRASADQALARAIVGEALRWLTDLDALIDSATKKRLPDDAKSRSVLRLMLAQALRLETPPHAVIATCLPLLSGGPRRLAHGVFSSLMKRELALPEVPTLPDRVVERWGDLAAAVAQGLAFPPEVDLAIKDVDETAARATAMGGVSLMPGHVRLPRGTPIGQLPDYKDGAWWVQDLAAQLPSRLLGAGDGQHALDLCAAPGGKTLALAANGWKVTALDISKRRLETLKENLKRTGLKASPVRADALTWKPKHQFEAILLDAPCTATGTCRRHPDVLHRIGPRQIAEMVEIQRTLIARAVEWLKPGGVFVYAVCSLEREEGEEQAKWVDEQFEIELATINVEELPAGIEPTAEGWLRTNPGLLANEGGLDGFFVARWTKS